MSELPRIPGYRVIRELGCGGMATVYLAVQEKLNRDVALKILSPALQSDREFTARFIREARTAANLHHTHIVAIHDVGRHGDIFYIVMECLSESLNDRILLKFGKPFTPQDIRTVLGPIAAALAYAHHQGIVHRDIKPDNIMFRADGTPVLVDFGLAKANAAAPGRHTDTRLAIGTPHYMSPEQGLGGPLDARSDIYSLGIVLFEMLTGHVPFNADSAMAVVLKHVQQPVPPLPPESARFQPLLELMLAKEPERRLQTAGELDGWLDRIGGAGTTVATPPPVAAASASQRRWSHLMIPILAAFALLAFAAGFFLTRHAAPPAKPLPPAVHRSSATASAHQPANEPLDFHAVCLARARACLDSGDLEGTRHYIEQATALRRSDESLELQRQLEEKTNARRSEPVRITAPRRSVPGGVKLPPPPPDHNPVKAPANLLRSTYAEIDATAARAMLRRFAFFDRYENSRGNFSGQLHRATVPGAARIEDQTSGLIWLAGGSEQAIAFSTIPAWLAELNRSDGAGAPWRLPTLEEAASLLTRERGAKGLFINPMFSADIPEIWTGDHVLGQPDKVWVVLFGDGCLGMQTDSARCFIRPVHTR